MAEHRCRWPQEPCQPCQSITDRQLELVRLRRVRVGCHAYYRRIAYWWEEEARRGYASSARSRVYAKTQRWLAELTIEYGAAPVPELLKRSGNKMPDFDALEAENRR